MATTGRRLLGAALALALGGCQAGYLWRQGWGQWRLSRRQVELDRLEREPSLTDSRREKLAWVPRILEFARQELDLTPGDAFTTYLDTRGRPVSTVVVAAHPEALVAYRWCFPIAGCVSYKGFFEERSARREAIRLSEEGWDVDLLPVAAYSTLGWFREPILSTLLDRELPDLVETVIHEAVHRTLWIPDHPELNEALAEHVAREGTEIFLARHEEEIGEAADRWRGRLRRRELDARLSTRLARDLESLYRSGIEREALFRRKEEILATARAARSRLLGAPVEEPRSNARVLAARQYNGLLPLLSRWQEEAGGHPARLMAYLKRRLRNGESLPEAR